MHHSGCTGRGAAKPRLFLGRELLSLFLRVAKHLVDRARAVQDRAARSALRELKLEQDAGLDRRAGQRAQGCRVRRG